MAKRFYAVTRDLHLYLGLFFSPFVLLFAFSVFYLVHVPLTRQVSPGPARLVTGIPMPLELELLTGQEQVQALRSTLTRLAVYGEISFVRRIAKEHRLIAFVVLPGRETTVDLNLPNQSATLVERSTGIPDALIHLHKMPGPHNVNIRGNSAYMKLWRVLADVVTYGVLFLTFSGIYLWAVLKAERRVGIILLSLGAVSFFGLIYAVSN
jgi:hypothetical protein